MSEIILNDKLNLTSTLFNTKKNKPQLKGILFEELTDDYGNTILKKVNENVVVFGGGILALEHLCNTTANFKPATLNQIYSLNNGIPGSNANSFISCFGVGIGGAALDFGNVYDPNMRHRDIPDLIPMRTSEELTDPDASKYFFKQINGAGPSYNYYLKEFESAPVIKSLWKDAGENDGTEIIAEIFDSERPEGIETFVEFTLKFNEYDVREYFESIAELDMARYNTIGLFTGEKVDIGDGIYDYVNVRLFSYLTFDNRSVKDKTVSTYKYRVYSIV